MKKATTIYLENEQHDRLIEEAYLQTKKTGKRVSISDLVREAINKLLNKQTPKSRCDRT